METMGIITLIAKGEGQILLEKKRKFPPSASSLVSCLSASPRAGDNCGKEAGLQLPGL